MRLIKNFHILAQAMKLLLVIMFITPNIYCSVFAQNLVPNPSFENVTSVPDDFYQIDRAIGWTSFGGTPDLFSILSPSSSSVLLPKNLAHDTGFQYPYDGNNIAVFVGYFAQSSEQREYLGVNLITPLQVGKTYKMSMYISLIDLDSSLGYCGAIDKIGMLFTTQSYSISSPIVSSNFAHLYTSSVISDTSGWIKIEGTFIADSAYEYLAIGNFFDNSSTNFVNFFPGCNYETAIYFVDSVSVIEDSINELYENLFESLLIIINPNDIALEFPNNDSSTHIDLIDISGKNCFSNYFINKISINTEYMENGIYLLRIVSEQNSHIRKVFINH